MINAQTHDASAQAVLGKWWTMQLVGMFCYKYEQERTGKNAPHSMIEC